MATYDATAMRHSIHELSWEGSYAKNKLIVTQAQAIDGNSEMPPLHLLLKRSLSASAMLQPSIILTAQKALVALQNKHMRGAPMQVDSLRFRQGLADLCGHEVHTLCSDIEVRIYMQITLGHGCVLIGIICMYHYAISQHGGAAEIDCD